MYNKATRWIEEEPRDQKYFESKYEARIEDSDKYRQHVRSMPYYQWDSKLPFDTELKVVPMKAIHMTSENLERLIKEHERADILQADAEYGKKVVNMLRADERVRDDNPAVAKAYSKYLMLLELCRK